MQLVPDGYSELLESIDEAIDPDNLSLEEAIEFLKNLRSDIDVRIDAFTRSTTAPATRRKSSFVDGLVAGGGTNIAED